ncbi:C-C motif chemokine 3-like [Centropristis striata]|uniref:C-C motif chemokine 3-like n=1 Tax=Centropristis striata TaxID=184440 RepID=UPI0027E0996D|nr:C-C motif chemokine 3-like [Centropristis striata]
MRGTLQLAVALLNILWIFLTPEAFSAHSTPVPGGGEPTMDWDGLEPTSPGSPPERPPKIPGGPLVCSGSFMGPDECCFVYYPRRVNRRLVSSCHITDPECPKPGVILVTNKGREFCVDPSLRWVVNMMQ